MIILMQTLKPILNIIKIRLSLLLFKNSFVLPYEKNLMQLRSSPINNTIETGTGIYCINNCGSNQNTQAIHNIKIYYKNKT